jgi:hypothetical protein
MDKALTDRIEQQVRQAFPDGATARVQVLQYGDDPEVEPGQAAVRAFFDWPGRSEGGQADPQTVHRFVTANAAALGVLHDGLAPRDRMGRVPPGRRGPVGQRWWPVLSDNRPRTDGRTR